MLRDLQGCFREGCKAGCKAGYNPEHALALRTTFGSYFPEPTCCSPHEMAHLVIKKQRVECSAQTAQGALSPVCTTNIVQWVMCARCRMHKMGIQCVVCCVHRVWPANCAMRSQRGAWCGAHNMQYAMCRVCNGRSAACKIHNVQCTKCAMCRVCVVQGAGCVELQCAKLRAMQNLLVQHAMCRVCTLEIARV